MGEGRFNTKQKLAELKREIGFRRRVYSRLVETGGMKQADAEYRIAVIEEIVRDYLQPPPPQLDLGEPS